MPDDAKDCLVDLVRLAICQNGLGWMVGPQPVTVFTLEGITMSNQARIDRIFSPSEMALSFPPAAAGWPTTHKES